MYIIRHGDLCTPSDKGAPGYHITGDLVTGVYSISPRISSVTVTWYPFRYGPLGTISLVIRYPSEYCITAYIVRHDAPAPAPVCAHASIKLVNITAHARKHVCPQTVRCWKIMSEKEEDPGNGNVRTGYWSEEVVRT